MVSGKPDFAARMGTIKARLGIGRMNYTVDPGLYALGAPDGNSPVMVTANYKLSFDRLRFAFGKRSAWILVLDTKGINVWCAAGKGTFGTAELVGRIKSSGVGKIVSHRRLILPQLSAPGVAAHEVRRNSGFRVTYGPVMAEDLPAFIDRGMVADRGMRTKRFPLAERAVLIPMEFIPALKWMAVLLPVFFVLGGLGFSAGFLQDALTHGLLAVLLLIGGLLAGSVITPLCLPWLPWRAFAAKGAAASIAVSAIITAFFPADYKHLSFLIETAGMSLISVALAAYLAMNFTGASTYTSLSGVRREMKIAVPAQIAAAVLGIILWGAARLL
ncbi:MAG: hypothetical protein K9J79_10500 [Desulfobacteraceae bacterium]|nr:hypothetical protein [Desulfobacteraceae bacterium]